MVGTHDGDDAYSDAETAERMEAGLRRALASPPKPHEPIGKRRGVERLKGSRDRSEGQQA